MTSGSTGKRNPSPFVGALAGLRARLTQSLLPACAPEDTSFRGASVGKIPVTSRPPAPGSRRVQGFNITNCPHMLLFSSLMVHSFVGCGAPPDDETTPSPTQAITPTPAPTPTPALFEFEDAAPLTRETVASVPVDFAAGLPDQTLYFLSEGAVKRRDRFSGTVTTLSYEDGLLTPYDLSSVVQLAPEDVHLLTGKAGVLVVTEDALQRSPLSDALETEGEIHALSAPGPDLSDPPDGVGEDDLWLSTEVGLRLYRGGHLYQLSTGELPATNAQLCYGPSPMDVPALWVLSERGLFALTERDSTFEVWDYGYLSNVDAIACTLDGSLWVLQGDDVLRRLPPEPNQPERWTPVPLPEPILALWAGEDSPTAWALSSSNTYLITENKIRTVKEPLYPTLRGGDTNGRLLTQETSVEASLLVRRLEGRPVIFSGLQSGAVLRDPIALYLFPTSPELVSEVQVRIDDVPVTVATNPWAVALDPLTIAEGLHFLTASVTYSDLTEPVTTDFDFIVGQFVPPNWEEDIKPIYQKSCSKCHGPGSSAYVLDNAQAWIDMYDTILDYVTAQYMPLPPTDPLTEEQIYTLMEWQKGGFLTE